MQSLWQREAEKQKTALGSYGILVYSWYLIAAHKHMRFMYRTLERKHS